MLIEEPFGKKETILATIQDLILIRLTGPGLGSCSVRKPPSVRLRWEESMCVYVHIYIYTYIYIYIHTYTYIYIYIFIRSYVNIYV